MLVTKTRNTHTHTHTHTQREDFFPSMVASKLQAFWNHPAGPKTIHFWAPTFKWVISIANVADFSKPPEQLSYPHQSVVAISGLIWTRYSTVIIPKNWNLVGVNLTMSGTGFYQLSRKIQHDYFSETKKEDVPKE
ncbi:Mitochondrial pyruvate carrier 4 [Camellia lanceoleosa]|uniref:Mitochondrial pyruvate carrier 4 n=1 Tax=Camellia lanceoleosa TaxID=1840588 RepID=A0ACC0H770_9ERIC|nr:Mitochondrial pyruvate carrier 4 [Camellia lanceoleosa]